MIVPSSNTVLEPEMCRLAALDGSVTLHFTRVQVTEIDLGPRASAQFDLAPMCEAASMLADAGLDALAWAGTSGSWLGLAQDQRLVAALAGETGVPCTTSTMAVLDACRNNVVTRVALITPYVESVVERIVGTLGREGVEVVAEAHLGLTDNHTFGLVDADEVRHLAAQACAGAGSAAQALLVLCTNFRAAPLLDELQARTGMAVLDSVAVTLSHATAIAQSEPASTASNGTVPNGAP